MLESVGHRPLVAVWVYITLGLIMVGQSRETLGGNDLNAKIMDTRFVVRHSSVYDTLSMVSNDRKTIQAFFHKKGLLQLKGLCNNLSFVISRFDDTSITLQNNQNDVSRWCGMDTALVEAMITKFLPNVHEAVFAGETLTLKAPNGEHIIMDRAKYKTFD
jgi:hypothetical protein